MEIASDVTIIAPPGTGKTTTLLQLAKHLLAANSIVPLYFRLGELSAGSLQLLASLHLRSAFMDVDREDVLALAERGRLLLLLDGWNELSAATRSKLRVELAQIRRDHPHMRFVATTRQQALDVLTTGPRISIEQLSDDQEMAIARANFGAAGEKLVDEAWRTPGVRELIAIPLYSSALLSSGAQDKKATTKEELLRSFVQEHDRAGDHAEALQASLLGCHPEILVALASHLNASGGTTMAESGARQIVASTLERLKQEGQILERPEPQLVIEMLTSHHTLTRSGAGNEIIGFQHQQFQEWYASHEGAELMRACAGGDAGSCVLLRAAIFDQMPWEESILFGAERLSREDDGAPVVAHAVRLAMPVDPMLAAEMIYRSSPAVWDLVKTDVLAFVNRWHQPGKVDRAVRFMIVTGRPEFESYIWPLAASENTQLQLPTLRAAPRFRPDVLGGNLSAKIAALPETTREHLLVLIAYESGVDGMDLATELAKADPSPKIQAEVVQYLLSRRANRHVASLLDAAHGDTWKLLASRGYAEVILDPAIASRLRSERESALTEAADPLERLRLLLEQPANYPGRDASIAAVIADASFPVRDQHADTSFYYAQERAPTAVLQGLRRRLEAGLELSFHAVEFLNQLDVVDDGPIAEAILDVAHDKMGANKIAVMAGPKTVLALLDKNLDCAQALLATPNDQKMGDEYYRLRSRVCATRPSSFVSAIMTRASTDDPHIIASLSSLVSLHGDSIGNKKSKMPIEAPLKDKIIGTLRHWVDAVISSPSGTKYQLNAVSNAIGRFGFRELVPELRRLLDEDLARLKKAIAGFSDARQRGDIRATSDASMRYGNQYCDAFSRLCGDEAAQVAGAYLEDRTFGADAAVILKSISDEQLNVPEPDFRRSWPWLGEVAAARAERATASEKEPANLLAVPIFAAIDRLSRPETDREGQLLAIRLARIALAMPHSNQDALMARVMALPQPLSSKREFFAALALDGQVLDADIVMQAVEEWLTEASASESKGWHKRQNTWEIEPWLQLLPFTNRPHAVIEGLTKVKAFYGSGWAQRWERVLMAVAAVPGPDGEVLLTTLARTHKNIASEYEWMKAILGRNSVSAVLLFIDLVIEGVFGQSRDAGTDWHVGRELAAYAEKFPQLNAELKRRYEAVGIGRARDMLEHFFSESADEKDLIAMIKKYAAAGQAYDGRVAAAVRAVGLRHEPVEEGSNAYNIYPAPVTQLRKVLFGLLGGSAQESVLAKECLIAIDELRDEYGIASNDVRHPDVMSGAAWPIETGSFLISSGE